MPQGKEKKESNGYDEQQNEETCANSEIPQSVKNKEDTKSTSCFDSLKMNSANQQEHNNKIQDHPDENIYELPALFNLIIQRYEGERCGGQFDGEGIACFEGGHIYKGSFSTGLMEGFGVFTWAGKMKYEGEFVRNMPQGEGIFTWSDGSSYKGDINHGVRHGSGTFTCTKTGVSYTGQWHQSKRHGKGAAFYNQEKTSWYKGDWVKNNREGWGERCYPSGNTYSGEWKNNLRNGEGTMKWLKQRQQYVGQWQDGVQHGRGTQVWILKRTNGFQYCESNCYTGEFVGGQRHGKGSFYYTSGAIYEGEWKYNKKHGQGKFTFKDGRVFEGDFVEDRMMTPGLSPSLHAMIPASGRDLTNLGPDMTLNLQSLLEKISERNQHVECQQVDFVVLRHSSQLRTIYTFYSRLGHSETPEPVLLCRLQLWRLLRDCNVHYHGVTLTQLDLHLREDSAAAEIHSPFTLMLLRRFLSSLVLVAFHIYHKDMESQKYLLASCFSKLLTDDILPNAKTVKGFLFKQPDCSETVSAKYLRKCWEIYEAQYTINGAPTEEHTMTWQQLFWMFKDFHLLDDKLTSARLLEVMAAESRDPCDLSSYLLQEITFLEFFEALLGCAEVKCGGWVSGGLQESLSPTKRSSTNDEEAERSLTPEFSTAQDVEIQQTQSQYAELISEEQTKHHQLELFHQFFIHHFFPAFDHHQLVSKNMKEEKLQEDQRVSVKAQHRARTSTQSI